MSERRSIPPMQYAPSEDGHANHGRVGVKKFQNWRGPVLKIPGGTLLAASGCHIIHRMRKTKRERRVTVRLSESLVDELSAEAVQDGRPLADYVRRLLVDVVATRLTQNGQPTAGA